MAESEKLIQNKIRAAVNRSGLAILWRNNTGKLPNGHGGFITFGLAVGSADLIGLIKGTAKFIAIEVKSLVGKASEEQRAWGEIVKRAGGVYAICRSPEEALEVIREALGKRD